MTPPVTYQAHRPDLREAAADLERAHWRHASLTPRIPNATPVTYRLYDPSASDSPPTCEVHPPRNAPPRRDQRDKRPPRVPSCSPSPDSDSDFAPSSTAAPGASAASAASSALAAARMRKGDADEVTAADGAGEVVDTDSDGAADLDAALEGAAGSVADEEGSVADGGLDYEPDGSAGAVGGGVPDDGSADAGDDDFDGLVGMLDGDEFDFGTPGAPPIAIDDADLDAPERTARRSRPSSAAPPSSGGVPRPAAPVAPPRAPSTTPNSMTGLAPAAPPADQLFAHASGWDAAGRARWRRLAAHHGRLRGRPPRLGRRRRGGGRCPHAPEARRCDGGRRRPRGHRLILPLALSRAPVD